MYLYSVQAVVYESVLVLVGWQRGGHVLVLLDQYPQCVGVRQRHIGVYAEVVIALWVLLTSVAAHRHTNTQTHIY